jgi:hypothetical protein
MATRGRESNRLYVDTMYDPDVATSHGPQQELTPADVLRNVLASAGADKSATITIAEEWADSQSITRLLAEYETIARRATEDRYAALVASSGLTPTEANAVRASEAWGPLMAALRDAESRGLDIDRAVPALVQGRTVTSADDSAAVLHGRVTKWLNAAGGHHQAERIVGLFPATTGTANPDIVQALRDRRTLIEQNARTLVLEALQGCDPWTRRLGAPPPNPVLREDWLRRLDTIAAYRDLWQVGGDEILGAEPRTRERMAQRQTAQRALSAALDAVPTPNSLNDARAEIGGLEPGSS